MSDDFLGLTIRSAHQADVALIEKWNSNGWRATGATSFDSIRLQNTGWVDGNQQVTTYLCLDVSNGDVIDAAGVSVARPDRPLRLPLEVEFETTASVPTDLKISRSEVWSGENYC